MRLTIEKYGSFCDIETGECGWHSHTFSKKNCTEPQSHPDLNRIRKQYVAVHISGIDKYVEIPEKLFHSEDRYGGWYIDLSEDFFCIFIAVEEIGTKRRVSTNQFWAWGKYHEIKGHDISPLLDLLLEKKPSAGSCIDYVPTFSSPPPRFKFISQNLCGEEAKIVSFVPENLAYKKIFVQFSFTHSGNKATIRSEEKNGPIFPTTPILAREPETWWEDYGKILNYINEPKFSILHLLISVIIVGTLLVFLSYNGKKSQPNRKPEEIAAIGKSISQPRLPDEIHKVPVPCVPPSSKPHLEYQEKFKHARLSTVPQKAHYVFPWGKILVTTTGFRYRMEKNISFKRHTDEEFWIKNDERKIGTLYLRKYSWKLEIPSLTNDSKTNTLVWETPEKNESAQMVISRDGIMIIVYHAYRKER